MTQGQRVIAVSQAIYDHVRDVYKVEEERLRLIHRGVDLKLFDPEKIAADQIHALRRKMQLPDNRPILLFPGRFTRWKGHEVVIQALKNLRDLPFFSIWVGDKLGHPAYVELLKTQIEQAGLDLHILMLEAVEDITSLYALSDVVLSPSLRPEAFGRIAMEAQAMGKIAIGANHGGTKEIIIPHVTGFLVEPRDPSHP